MFRGVSRSTSSQTEVLPYWLCDQNSKEEVEEFPIKTELFRLISCLLYTVWPFVLVLRASNSPVIIIGLLALPENNALQLTNQSTCYIGYEQESYIMIDYHSSICSCGIKAWEKMFWLGTRPQLWRLWYWCSALPTELSSQQGVGHVVGLLYNCRWWRCKQIVYLNCGECRHDS